jgi:hypothetical protein
MTTGATSSLRVEKMGAGSNLNTWGEPHLNDALDRFDTAIAGWLTKALTANYTLTSLNYVSDEARNASLKFTGTGAYSVTIPSVSKVYQVWNACTGILTITTGGSTNASIQPGEIVTVICDGANVYKQKLTDFGGSVLTSIGTPVNSTDAVTKAYADALAFASFSGSIPAQAGNSGKFLTTDGTNPSWAAPTVSQISNYASDQATKTATATSLAVAFAALL